MPRKKEPLPLSVVVGWCGELDSIGEDVGHERLLLCPFRSKMGLNVTGGSCAIFLLPFASFLAAAFLP